MAKNFGNAPSAKVISNVAEQSGKMATVVTVKNIDNDKLHDFPKNGENILDTADLEKSMKEMGFTDPIEVTDFGCADGEYMIVSGHRRRAAGVKCGFTYFPCIVKHFESDAEVENYVLFSNSQRDSGKDPLLYAKRYIRHAEYLKGIGFSGSIREEVAKRLGLSVQNADRYAAMSKIISPVWDMVQNEVCGISSVQPLASHTPEEQAEIHKMMQEAIDAGVSLTRDTVKKIVDGYREGKRSWKAVNEPVIKDSGLPLNPFINTEPSESRDPAEHSRNDEVRREFDPIAAEADADDAARAEWESTHGEDTEPDADGEAEPKQKKPPMTDEEKEAKRGADIPKLIEKLQSCFGDLYTIDEDAASDTMQDMESLAEVMIDELYSISREHNKGDIFKDLLNGIEAKVKEYL